MRTKCIELNIFFIKKGKCYLTVLPSVMEKTKTQTNLTSVCDFEKLVLGLTW